MRSTHPENQTGPRPAWNGVGIGLVALAVVLFVLVSPAQQQPAPETTTPSPPTISLDDLRAMLTDSPGETPPTIQVETPDGPVIVAVPTTAAPPRPEPRQTTTTSTTTTTQPPAPPVTRAPRDPADVMDGILEDLGLNVPAGPPSSLPERGASER